MKFEDWNKEEIKGIFALKHKRKTMFTITFNQKFSELPRWKSKINMEQFSRETRSDET